MGYPVKESKADECIYPAGEGCVFAVIARAHLTVIHMKTIAFSRALGAQAQYSANHEPIFPQFSHY